MRRAFRTAFLALSVLIAVGLIASWIRSYFRGDSVLYLADSGRVYNLGTEKGTLYFQLRPFINRYVPSGLNHRSFALNENTGDWLTAWRDSFEFAIRPGSPAADIAIPHALAVSAVALVALVPTLILSKRSRNPMQCAVCCYDLRGTPLRCPECGTAVSACTRRISEPQAPTRGYSCES